MKTLRHLETAPCRVLVIGDSHGDLTMVRNAIALAEHRHADLVVSVGDFGFWPGAEGRRFVSEVDRAAAGAAIPVAVVPGNHDDYDFLDGLERGDDGWLRPAGSVLAAPRGHAWQLGGHWWLACGGAASIDGPGGVWPQVRGPICKGEPMVVWGNVTPMRMPAPQDADLGGWWPQEVVTDDDVEVSVAAVERIEALGERVSVLVTHDAPSQVDISGGTPFPFGDTIRDRLGNIAQHARPELALFGHWHRHVKRQSPWGGVMVGLSADVNPQEPQWCIVDIAPDHGPNTEVPSPWGPERALT